MPRRRDDSQERRCDMREVGGLPDSRDKTFAPIAEVLYDEGIAHGVPPEA